MVTILTLSQKYQHMPLSMLAPWFGLMFPLAFSAGPNNVLCASLGMRFGIRKTLPFIAGINTSILFYSLLIGFGMDRLLDHLPWLFPVIKYAGSAYIFFLAWSFFRTKNKQKDKDEDVFRPGFMSGFTVSLLNPKLIYALAIMFVKFSSHTKGNFQEIILLTILVIIISASAHFTWLLGGNLISGKITSGKGLKLQNYVFGGILFLVAVWMLL